MSEETPNAMFRRLTGRSLYFNRQGEPVDDMVEWAGLMQESCVAYDEVRGWRVSTVFLGVDMRHVVMGDAPPLLFETMIFAPDNGGELDLRQWRYPTEAAAIAGHDQALALVCERTGAPGPIGYLRTELGELPAEARKRIESLPDGELDIDGEIVAEPGVEPGMP